MLEMNAMIAAYLEYGMSKQLREKTLLSYEQGLRLFAAWLEEQMGICDAEEIRDLTIRKYILDLQVRGKYTVCVEEETKRINYPEHRTDYGERVSSVTINNYLRIMRGFFTWLTEMEYMEKNPMKRIKPLPEQRIAKEYLEDAEVKALISVFNREVFSEYRDQIVMMIMLDSGTRLGETLSIETGQVDQFANTILLPANKTKGRRDRMVFFSQKTGKELRRWIRYKESVCDSPYVFPVQRNGQLLCVRNYEANFRKYLSRTAIQKNVSPHTLRNNFAKRCLLSGMDIYTLSRILGHSSVKVTEKAYLDVKDYELKKRYAQHSPLESVYRR